MAAADWRTSALIASIRRRGSAPLSSESWNEVDFLAALNEELSTYVVPLIRRTNEDHLIGYTDVSVVSGTNRYRLPAACAGEGLRDALWVDSAGNETPAERIDSARSVVAGYFLEGEDVVLWPSPTEAMTLRLKYVRRPAKLVGDERVLERVAGATGFASFGAYALDGETLSTVLGPLIAAAGMDHVSARPDFQLLGASLAVVYAPGAFTWSTTSRDGAVGDYLCYAGESPVPQIPVEAHPLLAQAVLAQYLTGQSGGIDAMAKIGKGQPVGMEADLVRLLSPRTQMQAKYIVNKNGAGWTTRRRWVR